MATITLSFDNGPTPGVTECVLDTLGWHDARANFFMIGSRIAEPGGRSLAERAVREGHVVGSHTWSHSVPFGRLDAAAVDRELDDAARMVADVGGDGLRFRPYGVGGAIDDRLMSVHGAERLRSGGYTCVLWNSVPRDWIDPNGWFDVAIADVATREWSVVVLHDVPVGALDRLDDFLARLKDCGHRLVLDTPDACTPIRAGRPTSSFALLGVGDAAPG